MRNLGDLVPTAVAIYNLGNLRNNLFPGGSPMTRKRSTLTVLLLLVPAWTVGQSLGEVAKKEKERRERNKQEGREVIVISEEELFPERAQGSESSETDGGEPGTPASSRSAPPPPRSGEDEPYDEELDYVEDGDVPQNIPPDAPLEERLEIFQEMKRHYEQQVREIDQAIAENNERIRQLDARIGATSAAGGAGLPVAPQTGTGAETTLMTGQESQTLMAERERLQAMNEQMTRRKERLKFDLQTKGRAAGIPPGYLRF